MKIVSKIFLALVVFSFLINPSFAFFNGKISKNHIFDSQTTLMNDLPDIKDLKNDEYWTKNIFYLNKYRPLFMISNKDLYEIAPKEEVNPVESQVVTPSVYNISFKTSSISSVSFKPIVSAKFNQHKKPVTRKKTVVASKDSVKNNLALKYEQAKNPGVDSDEKIQVAVMLKNTKNPANYNMAFDLLNDVIRKEPYNAYAFYLKGALYAQRRDSANAMKYYVQALKINPLSKQTCLGIAKVLEPTNKTLAQKYYQKAQND